MADLFLLSEAQMRGSRGFFRCRTASRGWTTGEVERDRVRDQESSFAGVDAPREYGPHKTIYNRFIRWSRQGVFDKIFAELARKGARARADHDRRRASKAHRTAASLLNKGLFPDAYRTPEGA